jgi:hypothetical protein
MAEVKNTFIGSKMNKDLDARILPNGQYRDAFNVSISRSEDADVGALENVLGNLLITDFGLTDCSLETIGYVIDVNNNRLFILLTNYTDSSPTHLTNNPYASESGPDNNVENYIVMYDARTNVGSILVGGSFLNFSTTHLVTGINIVESLLFWTDNRNQPRKINIDRAIADPYVIGGSNGYYTVEDHISVAKYYPFEPISLLEKPIGLNAPESTMKNVVDELLPFHGIFKVTGGNASPFINLDGTSGQMGWGLGNIWGPDVVITGKDIIPINPALPVEVINASEIGGITTINVSNCNIVTGWTGVIYAHYLNPEYNSVWPGDSNYLKDKFIRFSYRFKFDDGEYSLIAPFTQITFVPEQDGYFLGNNADPEEDNPSPGQEEEAYRSSIVSFMQNKINEIKLMIPAPSGQEDIMNWDEVNKKLHITDVEIVFKSAEDQSIKVVESLSLEQFQTLNQPFLSYDYQSQKPWKTLPTNELTRVSDVVPIRAQAQEVSGNRIIYGNFINRHSSPPPLDYTLDIPEKPELPASAFEPMENANWIRKEYQNHTVKQNRTYQVGVVLSDRYGRQSDVILSQIVNPDVPFGKASTIFHPYRDPSNYIITDQTDVIPPNQPDTWPGDMITMFWQNLIPETVPDTPGYPGLYSINDGSVSGAVEGTLSGDTGWPPNCTFSGYIEDESGNNMGNLTIETDATGTVIPGSMQFENTFGLEYGQTVCFVATSTTPPCIPPLGYPILCFSVETVQNNLLGWYSYKIVVKQTEQEYYNVYLPGILNGYPRDVIGRAGTGGWVQEFDAAGDPIDPVYHPALSAIDAVNYPKGEVNKTAHIVLINDNINKVPRDLTEVGPDQQQFRSSVVLYGRVENIKVDNAEVGVPKWSNLNKQFLPNQKGDTVNLIGPMTEIGLGSFTQAGTIYSNIAPMGEKNDAVNPNYNNCDDSYGESPLIPYNWYDGDSNPLIAKLTTTKEIGWISQPVGIDCGLRMSPFLAVYETKPVESKLDIYWETTTSGLISELNNNIEEGEDEFVAGLSYVGLNINEDDQPGTIISTSFYAVSVTGLDMFSAAYNTTIELISVQDGYGNEFAEVIGSPPKFKLNLVGPDNTYEVELMDFGVATNLGAHNLSWEDSALNNLTFTFKVTSQPNPLIAATESFFDISAIVQNTKPTQWSVDNPSPNDGSLVHPGVGVSLTQLKADAYNDFLIPARCLQGTTPDCNGCREQSNTNPYLNLHDINLGTQMIMPFWDGADPTDHGWDGKRGGGYLAGVKGPTATSATPQWNGVLACKNGIWGSDAPDLNVDDTLTPKEIEWEIVSSYQVSIIWGASSGDSGNTEGGGCQTYNPGVPPGPGTPYSEYVFGRPIQDTNMPTIRVMNDSLPQPWYDGNAYYGCPWDSVNCLELSQVQPGPMYLMGHQGYPTGVTWTTSGTPIDPSGATTGGVGFAPLVQPLYISPNVLDPRDSQAPGYGEDKVGAKNNGGQHYWRDLEEWSIANPGMKDILMPGSIGTFLYDTCCSDIPTGPWRLLHDKVFEESYIVVDPTCAPGVFGMKYWGDCENVTTIPDGSSVSGSDQRFCGWACNYYPNQTSIPRFVIKPFTDNTHSELSLARVRVEDGNGHVPQGEFGMPPGRYVVTVRAWDKSVNGSKTGLFTEWDLPVTILETFYGGEKGPFNYSVPCTLDETEFVFRPFGRNNSLHYMRRSDGTHQAPPNLPLNFAPSIGYPIFQDENVGGNDEPR